MKYTDEAVPPNMSDSMIQFDQGYNKVENNIEAVKKRWTIRNINYYKKFHVPNINIKNKIQKQRYFFVER